jgi:hypothetical protein
VKNGITTVILIFVSFHAIPQNRNSNWCFGDKSGITFTGSNTSLFSTAVVSRGSSASISDSLGQLLFYYAFDSSGSTGTGPPFKNGNIYNRFHEIMLNGDSIVTGFWYQEGVIVPFPDNLSMYYLFTIGVTGNYGLYYSIIDMAQDSGRGKVIQKNIQLQTFQASDCIQAIKHGNGRDWWIISRQSMVVNDKFYEYLITPSGISPVQIIHSGTATSNNNYRFTFSSSGNKMVSIDAPGLIELFNFDRCAGTISYEQTISNEVTINLPDYFGVAISPNERYLYITSFPNPDYPNYLFQFDLLAADIFASADTLWYFTMPVNAIGHLRLAPDDKIYLACTWTDGTYPYADNAFYPINNNLSVINRPDSAGDSCLFAPLSFNLGSGRCYWGLPNNPDYEMGSIAPCDSLTAVEQITLTNNSELFVYYHSGWQIAFINAKDLKGKNYSLSVFDLTGREVYWEDGKANRYFTKDLNCAEFANGMYIVTLQTDKEKLVKRFVKE